MPVAVPVDPLRRNPPRKVTTQRSGKRYLVVGGNGFLGSHVVEGLLARGEDRIRIFDLAPPALFDREIAGGKIEFVRGDVRDRAALAGACRAVDTAVHTVAAVNFWSDLPFEYDALHDVNVTGTENVIAACVAAGVGQLLHTSSSSVVVPRDLLARPLELADESAPYPTAPFLCHYIATKGLAERAVLAAHGKGGLATAALRPGGMYGPRDQTLTSAIARGLPGLGLADNIIDHIYVENVVHGFLLLEAALAIDSPVGGRAYFVTNYPEPPPGMRDLDRSYFKFNQAFYGAFHRRFKLAPRGVMAALAWTSQAVVRGSRGRLERMLGELRKLRPATLALSRGTYYFSHRRASADFGYQPIYGVAEGIALSAG